MTKIALQFHAGRAELLESLIPMWLQGEQVYLAWERFLPRLEWSLTEVDLLPSLDADQVSQIVISLHPIEAVGLSEKDFLKTTSGSLRILLGVSQDGALRESTIGSVTDDAEAVARWQKIVRRARAGLLQGASVVNSFSGVATARPHHRYSAGALEMQAQGVRMLAVGGTNRFVLAGVGSSARS